MVIMGSWTWGKVGVGKDTQKEHVTLSVIKNFGNYGGKWLMERRQPKDKHKKGSKHEERESWWEQRVSVVVFEEAVNCGHPLWPPPPLEATVLSSCTAVWPQLLAGELQPKAFWPTAVGYLRICFLFSYKNFYFLVSSFVSFLPVSSLVLGIWAVIWALEADKNGTWLGWGKGTVVGTGGRLQASGTKVQPDIMITCVLHPYRSSSQDRRKTWRNTKTFPNV